MLLFSSLGLKDGRFEWNENILKFLFHLDSFLDPQTTEDKRISNNKFTDEGMS